MKPISKETMLGDIRYLRAESKRSRDFQNLLLAGSGREGWERRADALDRIILIAEIVANLHGEMVFDYTNYRGEFRRRRVAPGHLTFGDTEYHPEPQWFLVALDLETGLERTFAVRDIKLLPPDPEQETST